MVRERCLLFVNDRKSQFVSIINPDFDFKTMGIGGLDAEFNAIFRRAFASRVFPPDLVHQLGMVDFDARRMIIKFSSRHEALSRYSIVWPTGYWKDPDGSVGMVYCEQLLR